MADLGGPSAAAELLRQLARNLWWCWDAEATALFAELDPELWREGACNPLVVLREMPPARLATAVALPSRRARIEAVHRRFSEYMAGTSGAARPGGAGAPSARHPIAYFCAEYGLHESLPIYSGGLGILAGDHLKSASDLALPLVAVGLFYRAGYMAQQVTESHEQLALEHYNDPAELPLEALTEDGRPIEIGVPLPGRELRLRGWRVAVGRVPLYLLDADIDGNSGEDRVITRRLYGGAEKMRIEQELVLGCGGARLLARLGIEPSVWHMNEGHAAFLTLERAARARQQGLDFAAAKEQVRASTLFTTHTPVPAGHDKFDEPLIRPYLETFAHQLGLPWPSFFDLARAESERNLFNMTLLALAFSARCNAVSKLHAVATRQLLGSLSPESDGLELAIDSITNGVHLATWTHPRISAALGAPDRPVRGADFAQAGRRIAPAELWRHRREMKRALLASIERSLSRMALRGDALVPRMVAGLDERALLIGFARRFASYKRADLLLRDPERLARLLGSHERPARILIAGKAHPRDARGRDILKAIVEAGRREPLLGKVLFLENYEIDLARSLVQGVDVWINTPRRMQEASGTSGMKAAANGALNLSIADGWWPEAAAEGNGWTIAPAPPQDSESVQDAVDGEDLYRRLEQDVVPLFWKRDHEDVPVDWLRMVLRNLETIPPVFNTDRMVLEYLERAYRALATGAARVDPSGVTP